MEKAKTKEQIAEFCADKVQRLIADGSITEYLRKKLRDFDGPGMNWIGDPTDNVLSEAVIFPEYEYRVVMLPSGLVYTIWNARQGMTGFRPLTAHAQGKPNTRGDSYFIYAIRCQGKTVQVSLKRLREQAVQIWLDSRKPPMQDDANTDNADAGSSPNAVQSTEFATF